MNNVSKWTINMDKDVLYGTYGFPKVNNLALMLINHFKHASIVSSFTVNENYKIMWLRNDYGDDILISSAFHIPSDKNEVLFIKTNNPERDWGNMLRQAKAKKVS